MLIGDLLDTLLNLTTFAFIGFAAWVLLRSSGTNKKK